MGTQNSEFAPLESERAKELEFIIDHASQNKEAVVFDPDKGIQGAQPLNQLSGATNINGLHRYRRHYVSVLG